MNERNNNEHNRIWSFDFLSRSLDQTLVRLVLNVSANQRNRGEVEELNIAEQN